MPPYVFRHAEFSGINEFTENLISSQKLVFEGGRIIMKWSVGGEN